MRFKFDIMILLAPAMAVLLLWQTAGVVRIRPADIAGADRLAGFSVPEEGPAGTFRWGGPQARVSLPAGGLPGVLMLRGAVAPGAHVRVGLGKLPPVDLPAGDDLPQLRRYTMLLPVAPDPLGWAALTIAADPPARIDGRDLGMALADIAIHPISRGPRWPPAFVWLAAACLPALLAAALALAGAPRRLATAAAALVGVGVAWLWAGDPAGAYPWLLDLRALLGEPLILRWWLAAQLLGLAAWPLTARMLRGLPMAGYPLAKAFGLLLISWVAWILASVGLAPFSLASVLGSALLVAAIAWLPPMIGRQLPAPPAWRAALAYELLFLGGLCVGIWLRWHGAVGPAITGTEKPMEIAFINAVLRYGQLPPLDPWLAGLSLNYYYLGFVVVAAVTLLTGVPSSLAFNLAFGLVVALTVVGAAYAAHALVALSARPAGRSTRAGVALLAVLCCLAIGNQSSALQLIIGAPVVRALDAGQLVSAVAQRLAGADTIQLGRPTPPTWDGPPLATITPAAGPSFDWFVPSRVIYDDVALPAGGVERRYAITEFPAFSLYVGDLHTHILAMPFDLLSIAFALALAAAGQTRPRPAHEIMLLAANGLIIGCLYGINTWHAPTFALLAAGALAIGLRAGPRFAWRPYALRLAALAGATLVSALPFMLTFRPPATSVSGPVSGLPIIGRLAATFGLAQNHTQLHSFLIIFGLFLIVLLAFLAQPLFARPLALGRRGAVIGALLLCVSVPAGLLVGFPLLFLIPLACLLAARAWARSAAPGEAVVAWAAAVSCLILLACEVVYIRDYLEGEMSRLNTIYKFYFQAWILLGIVAAYAAWSSLCAYRWRWPTWLWAPPAALLLAGSLAYPLGLLRWAEPWQPAERTLDGLALMSRERPDELAAARWMAANVAPQEVVLTGFCNNCDYEAITRASSVSGAQTLLGWMDGHERAWRSGAPDQLAEIAARERDIPAIYRAADGAAARALLDRYGVRYIYLGPVERQLYGEGAAAFARALPIAFSQGGVTIYRVP